MIHWRGIGFTTGAKTDSSVGIETRILEVIQNHGGEATAREIARSIQKFRKPGCSEACERKLSEMVKAGILETEYKQSDKGGQGKTVYRMKSGGDTTGSCDTVTRDTTPIFPEENDSCVTCHTVTGGVVSPLESETGGQKQAGDVVVEKWQPQSVPLTRRPKRIIEQQSNQEPEVTPCDNKQQDLF